MSTNRTIIVTEYCNLKVWPDGGESISFKLDPFVRKKIEELPDGVFLTIKPSSKEGRGSHYMSAKLPG